MWMCLPNFEILTCFKVRQNFMLIVVATYTVLVNGLVSEQLKISRGIRQGMPTFCFTLHFGS